MSALRLLGLTMVSSLLLAGCSSAKKIEVGGNCILNSDCNSPLLCTDGKCHDACHASVDCPTGQNCVKTNDSTFCQLPAEADCSRTTCSSAYVCASDLRCRTGCQSPTDCANGQVCVTNVCADPIELVPSTGQLPQKGPSLAADGGTDAQATATGGAGGGGGLGGASGSSGGAEDAAAGGSGGGGGPGGAGGASGGAGDAAVFGSGGTADAAAAGSGGTKDAASGLGGAGGSSGGAGGAAGSGGGGSNSAGGSSGSSGSSAGGSSNSGGTTNNGGTTSTGGTTYAPTGGTTTVTPTDGSTTVTPTDGSTIIPTGTTVTFANGRAVGAMTGYSWVALGALDFITDPTCGPSKATISAATLCATNPNWSGSGMLCISGAVPAQGTPPDYVGNWGVSVGVNSDTSGGGLGQSFSSITITVTGTPNLGLRALVHRRGDTDGTNYCHALISDTAIPLTSFSTACYVPASPGTAITAADIPNIDKISVQVSSGNTAITVSNLCMTGITFTR